MDAWMYHFFPCMLVRLLRINEMYNKVGMRCFNYPLRWTIGLGMNYTISSLLGTTAAQIQFGSELKKQRKRKKEGERDREREGGWGVRRMRKKSSGNVFASFMADISSTETSI